MNIVNEQPKNFLYHDKEVNKKGQRRSIAGELVGNTLRIGISTCGPRDRFVRRLGASISTGRAHKNPSNVITLENGQDVREIFFNACNQA